MMQRHKHVWSFVSRKGHSQADLQRNQAKSWMAARMGGREESKANVSITRAADRKKRSGLVSWKFCSEAQKQPCGTGPHG